jgi:2-polyprenyl-3-methyl-5-hydroxy-6-metoxy-1,4-benzoquinol methylase
VTDPVDIVRAGYDAVSYRYRADDSDEGRYAAWIDTIRTHFAPAGAVLDAGCGCGVPVSRSLAQAGCEVVGVDLSDVQIERARRVVPAATFIRADLTEVDFEATYRVWLQAAGLRIVVEDFVPEGDGGHAFFSAARGESPACLPA